MFLFPQQPVVYSGLGPHLAGPQPQAEAVYMAPPEPPLSIYGTLPRGRGRQRSGPQRAGSEASLPVTSHYATTRPRPRERLGPRVSGRLRQMLEEGQHQAEDTVSIMSSSSGSGPRTRPAPVAAPRKEIEAEKVSDSDELVFGPHHR